MSFKPKNQQPDTPLSESALGWAPWALFAAGLFLVAASFVVGKHAAAGYSQEDALSYQQVSDRLHELTMSEAASPSASPENRRKLADAQAEFVELRTRLDDARTRGPRLKSTLRYSGAVLVAAGLVVLVAFQRQA